MVHYLFHWIIPEKLPQNPSESNKNESPHPGENWEHHRHAQIS